MNHYCKFTLAVNTFNVFYRRRKAGKSDFATSANMAYGQMKLEALGGVGGEYEHLDKLWARSGRGGEGNYVQTQCPAPYEFPVSKPEAPVYASYSR